METADIARWRAQFPVLQHTAYLNSGTYGALPTPVADTLCAWYRMLEAEGPWSPAVMQRADEMFERVRGKVAALLGAEPDEIALTRSVTDGINIIAHGLRWQPGDEVILSDREHECAWVIWHEIARRYGVRLRIFALANDPDELLAGVAALITPRTRLIFCSHISCVTGLVAPGAALAELAHRHGALLMLDGAHAVGQIPVDVHALGCDFYASCGHKWVMGPQGTGFLYVAAAQLAQVEPSWVGAGSRSRECKGPGDERLLWAEGGRRFENATRAWGLYAGLETALEIVQTIGPANIAAHVQTLVRPFKEALQELPRLRLLTPLAAERSAGLVAAEMSGYRDELLSRRYDERRLLFPCAPRDDGTHWMRVAVAYYVLPDELQRVIALLREASVDGGAESVQAVAPAAHMPISGRP